MRTQKWLRDLKQYFSPGDPGESLPYKRGAVRLVRVYESGRDNCCSFKENSLFGVLSLLTGHRSDRFYHAIAFTRVEMITAPANSVLRAIEEDACMIIRRVFLSRILQTETMIETLTHRDMFFSFSKLFNGSL